MFHNACHILLEGIETGPATSDELLRATRIKPVGDANGPLRPVGDNGFEIDKAGQEQTHRLWQRAQRRRVDRELIYDHCEKKGKKIDLRSTRDALCMYIAGERNPRVGAPASIIATSLTQETCECSPLGIDKRLDPWPRPVRHGTEGMIKKAT